MAPRNSDSGNGPSTEGFPYQKVGIFWKVGVFWDYENCSVPRGMSGAEVANKIGDAFCEFGQVVLLKSYLEKSGETFSDRVINLQSELQGSGVSLTLCPPRGSKETVDPMIVADMMAFAMDNPPHSVIVLISGDGDFSYALSLLKRRHYTICVVVNNANAPDVLRTAATHVMNWRLDVLKHTVVDEFIGEATGTVPTPPTTTRRDGDAETDPVAPSPPLQNGALTTRRKSNSASTSSTDLDNFTELVEVLKAFQREENVKPLRSQVATRVKIRNPLLYGRSGGPKKFTDYAAAAESKGLVKMGGTGGYEWIALV
ncbi:hypothetical protein HK104_009314 [Borealophlyctis nickersoniae]|nr:hypothetical protein HK104_009314 [Borealophlyctis nickersoniae]